MNYLALFEAKALAFILSVFDTRSPLKTKVVALLGLLYVLSPFDLVPDFIPLAGWIDDIVLVPFGFSIVAKYIPEVVWSQAMNRAERIVKKLKYTLLSIIAVILLLIGYMAYKILQ